MKWGTKLILVLVIALLIVGIFGIVYAVRARLKTNEYQFRVDAVLQAALVANDGEAVTDPALAVIAEYDGRASVIAPGNYMALSYYLRMDSMMPPWGRIDPKKAIRITVCDEAVFEVMPYDDSGDRILIRLTTGGDSFLMRARGGNLWTNLIECAMKGTYHDQNVSLDTSD